MPRAKQDTSLGVDKLGAGIITTVLIALILLFAASSFIAIVPAGAVGIRETFGNVHPEELQPGIHLKAPWVNVKEFNVRSQELKETALTPSNEGLLVKLETSVIYKVNAALADEIYKKVGYDFHEVIIKPMLRSELREITARYQAKALYTEGRNLIRDEAFNSLVPKFAERGIILEELLLRDVGLPDKLTEAIENKLQAEQEIERREFEVEQERLKAEQRIVEAEGIKQANIVVAEGDKQAKILEAEGIQKVQDTITQGLTDEYMEWFWLNQLDAADTLYIATEAGLPLFKGV